MPDLPDMEPVEPLPVQMRWVPVLGARIARMFLAGANFVEELGTALEDMLQPSAWAVDEEQACKRLAQLERLLRSPLGACLHPSLSPLSPLSSLSLLSHLRSFGLLRVPCVLRGFRLPFAWARFLALDMDGGPKRRSLRGHSDALERLKPPAFTSRDIFLH